MRLFSIFNRRASIGALSCLDDRRLADLGIDRYDLFHARHLNSAGASALLTARRDARAELALR